ncbi:MAG: hypothetical protein ACOYB1_01740 [Limnohabitans sp.]
MNSNSIVHVRGFDLFFSDASALTIENIAKQLGGRFSFNTEEGRATHMFENIQKIPDSEIFNIHKTLRNFGEMFALTYNCKYICSELYVTTSQDWIDKLKNVQK